MGPDDALRGVLDRERTWGVCLYSEVIGPFPSDGRGKVCFRADDSEAASARWEGGIPRAQGAPMNVLAGCALG